MPTDPFTCRGKYSVIVNHMTRLAKLVICASKVVIDGGFYAVVEVVE